MKDNKRKIAVYIDKEYPTPTEVVSYLELFDAMNRNDIFICSKNERVELLGRWRVADYVHAIVGKLKRWLCR